METEHEKMMRHIWRTPYNELRERCKGVGTNVMHIFLWENGWTFEEAMAEFYRVAKAEAKYYGN